MLIAPGYTPSLFSLHKRFKDELTARSPEWKSVMAEFTFMRTYSRRKPSGSLETWAECVIRVIEGMFTVLKTHAKSNMTPWDEKRAQKHAQEAAERMFSFKWLPPGRGLWIMGTPFMWEKGGAALNNCGFVSTEKMVLSDGVVDEELTAPFRFLMDMSMLGVGVGFDTKAAEHKIPIVGWDTTVEYRMVVEDSREGWVDYMVEVLRACVRGHPMVVPDVSKVRPEGAPIKGFGGVASGPGPLIHLGAGIADVLNSNAGGHITSTIITDIMNLIGKCVVAGNVRRTAEIAFGELEDEDFATLKDWSTNPVEMGSAAPEEMRLESPKDFEAFNTNLWNPSSGVCSALTKKYADRAWAYKLGGWRWCSNNSVFARVGMDYEKYEKSIGESGEPGFAWLDLMRSHGRMKDAANNRDHRVMGGNPCVVGSTLVAVADGRNAVPIRDLVGSIYPVYSRDSNGKVVIRNSVKTWKTREDAEIWRLTLDDGSTLLATPDHMIMLRDGSYKQLRDLASGESLMPFDSVRSKHGYRNIKGTGKRASGLRQYRLIFEHEHGYLPDAKKFAIHHRDYDKTNDGVSNLELMTQAEHSSHHRLVKNPMHNPATVEKMKETIRVNGTHSGANNAMFGRRHSEKTRQKIGERSRQNWERQGDFMAATIREGMDNPATRAKISAARTSYFNHKVASVEFYGYEDVYDMTVEETHNFGVVTSGDDKYVQSSGIFVHNCLEQSLESYELCCLVETFPSHAEDYWDFQRTLKFAYLYAKAVSLMGTHFERTNAIVIRNRRIGTSMSGVVDAIQKFGRTKFMQEFCDRGYDYVCYVDKKYSEWLGVPESIKKTSNKPSGTVSLLASVFGPGVHWPKMRTGYRLIRLASNSEYVDILRASGFRIEPSVSDPIRTVVVYFPWLIPDGIPADSEVSIWEKFKLAADMQYWWADNQVSCTVEFTQAELDRHEISRCLEAFDGQIKGISLLPSAEGVYPQMPFTKAPREEVEAYAATLKPVDFSSLTREGDNAESNKFCDSEGCLI